MKAAKQTALERFAGRAVTKASVSVRNAGDGLSEALEVDPALYQIGDVLDVVLRCAVTGVQYKTLGDTGELVRVHVLRAGVASIVAAEDVDEILEAQQLRNEEHRGVTRLPLGDNGDGDG